MGKYAELKRKGETAPSDVDSGKIVTEDYKDWYPTAIIEWNHIGVSTKITYYRVLKDSNFK